MTIYQFEMTVRTPLHVGSGGVPLRRNVDFVSFGRFVYVFDIDRIFDYILPESADVALIERITSSANLASFLKESDFRSHPELAQYRLGGSSNVGEIRPQIKDARGQPYLPGSTIKGAIRTALGVAMLEAHQVNIKLDALDGNRERAAQRLEQELFSDPSPRSKAPNYDLLRVFQSTDSQPVDPGALSLENVAVWPTGQQGILIDVEAVRPGTRFTSRFKQDDNLLDTQSEALHFGQRAPFAHDWLAICKAHGLEQLREEAAFFTERKAAEIASHYQKLLYEAEHDPDDVFWMQLGWGTGWTSKTFSRVIKRDKHVLSAIIDQYRLTPGVHHVDDPFPLSRHVIAYNGRPREPLGWVRVHVSG